MNSQDLYNLQEAYIGVYADLDEERAEGVKPYGGGKEVGDRMRAGHGIKAKEKPLSGEKGDGSGYGEDKKFTKPDDKIEKPGTTVPAPKKGGYGRISPVIPYGIGANATKERSANSRIRRLDPGAPTSQKLPPPDKKKPSKEVIRKKTNEEVDIYDIILSHLLDEGYADTYEAAEAIMVNMSEDWRESICEEYDIYEEQKDLPVSRMSKQARRKAFRLGNEINDPESGIGLNVKDDPTAKQLRNMSRVGGKQVKGHIKKGYEQGRLYDPQNAELNWKRNSKG
jgi:hypothetical protein